MKRLQSAAVAGAVSAMLVLAPLPAGAGPHGAGAPHFSGHRHGFSGHHQPFSGHSLPSRSRGNGSSGAFYAPFYGGGVVAAASDDSGGVVNYGEPPTVVYVALPPQALSCHRSRETVTVPAETGGTKAITVTRC